MADFKKVASLSEISEGAVKGVNVAGERIALFNLGGEIFATSDVCTHVGCLLSENNLVEPATSPSQEGEAIVECTCHGSKFNIKTGEATSPPAVEPLKTYQVKIEGEDVLIKV